MESPKIPGNESMPVINPIEIISKFGIGHMPENTPFSIENIDIGERAEIVETYKLATEKIEMLLDYVDKMISKVNTENAGAEVFDDLVNGIRDALYKTANQILLHGAENPDESLVALDELNMILSSVNNSLTSPEIIAKKKYPNSSIYELEFPQDTEGFEIKTFDSLFSKDHIAFNLTSIPTYQDTDKIIKSGIRLDYGPLYKETPEGIDRTKTQWITSVDISGYYIDKIMNKYSPRGHHFTRMFEYKINLLIQGLARQMEKYFDK